MPFSPPPSSLSLGTVSNTSTFTKMSGEGAQHVSPRDVKVGGKEGKLSLLSSLV